MICCVNVIVIMLPGKRMKIEMGESLVRTWIRHCQDCQLAELNWKPSPKWADSNPITPELEQWFNEGKAQLSANVFKKTAKIKQFLGQGEIDILGLCIEQGMIKKIIAADIAFHTKGLQYGSKVATQERIIKKLFRTALTIERYFPGVPAEIFFLSPKVNPATVLGVSEAEQIMQIFFANKRKNFRFRTIINAEFKNLVLDKIIPLQNIVADTSELFLRSVQLMALFSDCSLPHKG